MNPATKYVLQWHLGNSGATGEDIETLISVLARGVEKKEEDSILLTAQLLAAAAIASDGAEDGDSIKRLLELHFHLETLGAAERKLDAVEQIAAIIETDATGPFAQRIRNWKLAELRPALEWTPEG